MEPSFFDEVIEIHQRDIASFQRRVRLLIVGGGLILLVSIISWILVFQKKWDSNVAPSLSSLMGAFVCVSSLFPYKEITPRKISLAKLRMLKKEWEKIQAFPEREREKRMKEFNEYLSIFQ